MQSIFHKIVGKEDEFTQLLFNLMQLLPDFRNSIVRLLLSHPDSISVGADEVETQRHAGEMGDCGRPDISISSASINAFIEVKVDPTCGLTQSQEIEVDSATELRNYISALAVPVSALRTKSLVYLVPRDWAFLPKLQDSIRSQSAALEAKGICVRTKHWEEMLDALNDGTIPNENQLVQEFRLLLTEQFGPVTLSMEDLKMLFSKDYVNAWMAMQRLQSLIDDIEKAGGRSGYAVSKSRAKDEYGLYFSLLEAKEQLWFGTWCQFLEKHGCPLCFGIQMNKATQRMKSGFDTICRGTMHEFMGYKVGCITRDAVESSERVWNELAPVLESVLGKPGHLAD